MRTSTQRGRAFRIVGALSILAAGACSEEPQSRAGEPTPEDWQRFSGRSVPKAYPPPLPVRVKPPSTGNADHDYLRLMSDHHKDVIRITHAAIESNRDPSLHAAIRRVEEEHDHTLDEMLALLRTIYGDAYVPQANPENDLTADVLRKSSREYTQIFLAAADKSEAEALGIVDNYLPNAKNSRVRAFAEKLRREERSGFAALRRALTRQSTPKPGG
jgi:uncharacterized protein (DUF305 family)